MASTISNADRDAILENATKTRLLIQDPFTFLQDTLVQQQQYNCLQWLSRFNVFSIVPQPPGSISYKEVAAKANVPESTLRSVARMAMTAGLFAETPTGQLCHSKLSGPFVVNEHLRKIMWHMLNRSGPVMAGLTPATEKWGTSKELNQTAYNMAFNTDLSFWDHLATVPELSDESDEFMKSRAISHPYTSAKHLLNGFDWEGLTGGTVVDIGGGAGAATTTLAVAYPKLKYKIQDLARPIENARTHVATFAGDVVSRIEFQEHDFFTPQPMIGSEIYLLRTIIHDWPDEDAIRLLNRTAEAMSQSSHLLIMDIVLPSPGTGPVTLEAALRQKDMAMINAFNATERDVKDWEILISKVKPQLRINSIVLPPGSHLSVIDCVLEEKQNGYANGNGHH